MAFISSLWHFLRAPLKIGFGHERPLCNKVQRVATTVNTELLEVSYIELLEGPLKLIHDSSIDTIWAKKLTWIRIKAESLAGQNNKERM